MRQAVPLLATMLFAMVLLASGIETGIAEPQKNQISVPVKCDNGEKYTLVFNGEGNAGHVEFAGPNNIIPKSYSVTYLDPETGEVIATDKFHQGNREGQEDLIHCRGRITTELFGLGTVTAVFDFEGLVTPRSIQ
jgi:hypothetical protein